MKIGQSPNYPLQKKIKLFFVMSIQKNMMLYKKNQVFFLSMVLMKIKWTLDFPLPKRTWKLGGHLIFLYQKNSSFLLAWALRRWPFDFPYPKEEIPFFQKKKTQATIWFFFPWGGKNEQPYSFLYHNVLYNIKLHWNYFLLLKLLKEQKFMVHHILNIK